MWVEERGSGRGIELSGGWVIIWWGGDVGVIDNGINRKEIWLKVEREIIELTSYNNIALNKDHNNVVEGIKKKNKQTKEK